MDEEDFIEFIKEKLIALDCKFLGCTTSEYSTVGKDVEKTYLLYNIKYSFVCTDKDIIVLGEDIREPKNYFIEINVPTKTFQFSHEGDTNEYNLLKKYNSHSSHIFFYDRRKLDNIYMDYNPIRLYIKFVNTKCEYTLDYNSSNDIYINLFIKLFQKHLIKQLIK